jgi:hypothetical protein
MSYKEEIYFLNNRHSVIINDYLTKVQNLMDSSTFFNEDYVGYEVLVLNVIDYHNGLSKYVSEGLVNRRDWFVSLPNNLYWATKGYLANLQLNQNEDIYYCEEKLLSLTLDVLDELNESILIHPFTEKEYKINLN